MTTKTQRRIRIFADDLTGALECAAAFAHSLSPVAVLNLNAQPSKASDHSTTSIISLNTRDAPADEAKAAIARALRSINNDTLCLHKIDSQMRGNVVPELAAFFWSGRFNTIGVAPALPREGRIMINGQQYAVSDKMHTALGENLLTALARMGIPTHRWMGVTEPCEQLVCNVADAHTDADLRDSAQQWLQLNRPLISGSFGLVSAVAAVLGYTSHPVAHRPRPAMCFIGSRHDQISAQVLLARQARHRAAIMDGNAPASEAKLLLADPKATSAQQARQRFELSIQKIIERQNAPACVFVSGGSTLNHMMEVLGCNQLLCYGEVLPGAPLSEFVGGAWAKTRVISRSGGFGAKTDLLRLLGTAPAPANRPVGVSLVRGWEP